MILAIDLVCIYIAAGTVELLLIALLIEPSLAEAWPWHSPIELRVSLTTATIVGEVAGGFFWGWVGDRFGTSMLRQMYQEIHHRTIRLSCLECIQLIPLHLPRSTLVLFGHVLFGGDLCPVVAMCVILMAILSMSRCTWRCTW